MDSISLLATTVSDGGAAVVGFTAVVFAVDCPAVGAAAHDHAPAAESTAVTVDRGDTDEGSDPAPIEMAKLGQVGDQGTGRGPADAGNGGEQVFGGPPGGRAADGVVEVGLDPAELLLQPDDMGLDAAGQLGVAELAAALALAADHLDQLPAPGDELAELPCGRVRQQPRLRPDRLGEAGDGLGIEAVGLGEPAGRTGEVADLARVDDGQRQPRRGQSGGDGGLEAARRLQHDQAWCGLRQALDERREPRPVAAERKALALGPQMHVEPILGHIDASEHRLTRGMLHDPSLHMRARPEAAQATVRAREHAGGRGAELRHGLDHPRCQRAPVHHQACHARQAWQLRDTRGTELDSRILDLIATVIEPCEQPGEPGLGHPPAATVRALIFPRLGGHLC